MVGLDGVMIVSVLWSDWLQDHRGSGWCDYCVIVVTMGCVLIMSVLWSDWLQDHGGSRRCADRAAVSGCQSRILQLCGWTSHVDYHWGHPFPGAGCGCGQHLHLGPVLSGREWVCVCVFQSCHVYEIERKSVCVRVSERERESVCVSVSLCVCVFACMCMHACMCVCVWVCVCVCACVCVCENEGMICYLKTFGWWFCVSSVTNEGLMRRWRSRLDVCWGMLDPACFLLASLSLSPSSSVGSSFTSYCLFQSVWEGVCVLSIWKLNCDFILIFELEKNFESWNLWSLSQSQEVILSRSSRFCFIESLVIGSVLYTSH